MVHRLGSVSLLAIMALAPACGENRLKGPEAEVSALATKVDVPKVPTGFGDLPAPPNDGSHTVKELRVKGKKFLETDVTVKGYVTWAYDCVTAVRQPGEDDKSVWARIEENPTMCERSRFYVGDSKDTPPEKSLWVVDVPRNFTASEVKKFKKKTREAEPLRCEPDEKDAKKKFCPPYTVGDQVEIVGTWKVSSPHGDRNSEGLLVYKRMKNETQKWESPAVDPTAPTGPTGPAPAAGGAPPKPSPQDLVNRRGKG